MTTHALLNIAERAARAAGHCIMRAYERVDTLTITEKRPNDFVTEVDKQAENEIISIIHKAYPNHGILGEETGSTPGDETVWIIDPLDGTTNFLHSFPHFAVSIAVQHKNRIEHAIIYDPIRQEIFAASRGGGARVNNNKRLRVANLRTLGGALLGTGFPFREDQPFETYISTFKALAPQVAGIRRAGSATLDLAYVAAGRLDGFWEFGLGPWDLAAGSLLIKEAGGLVGDFNGTEQFMESGNIVAGNPKIFKAILQSIQPALKTM
jgi:myo-inositol-1(or 4)-monophosphatase